ncbi:MAG: DUF2927 domain-containing protein [Pseudomonadota bacterium]
MSWRSAVAALGLLAGACVEVDYNILWQDIEARGGMRQDRAPADAPYSNADLVRNFESIVFFSEFTRIGKELIPARSSIKLRRWTEDVRIGVLFGPEVSADQRRRDLIDIGSFAARLGPLTGLTFEVLPEDSEEMPNFIIYVADQGTRSAFADALADEVPEADPVLLQDLRVDRSREISPCFAYTFGPGGGVIDYAFIVVKHEALGLLRTSCFHEEMAQALGPGNDDELARPSIFNDDEEFALLTEHDEYLLRMLYDPSLRPGMTADEARPLLAPLVDRLRPEGAAVN